MSVINPHVVGDTVFLDPAECVRAGDALSVSYRTARPFPHVVVDEFLPTSLLRRVVKEFPTRMPGRFANAWSNLKTGYQLGSIRSPFITNLLHALNSAHFLGFMEHLTGIEGLIPDPYYLGGGLHETARGGYLKIHADFNFHEKLKLVRRVNLIVFLNEDWQEAYGGHLELWSRDMSRCERRVLPVMGRAVAFNTDEFCYHGHPEPLACPESTYRRSIALYYYTVPRREIAKHTTRFKVRPGTADRWNWRQALREWGRDWCPPRLWRLLTQIRHRVP